MSKERATESAVSRRESIQEDKMPEEKELRKKLSRKDFVKGAAAVAGAGALASCAPAATPAPADTPKPVPTCPPAAECPAPWLPERWDYEADVVVVGCGGAGISAAIAAYDAGAEVLVLEKDAENRGGNTGCCGGFVQVVSPVEDAIDYLRAECWGTVTDEELIRATVLASDDLPAWIESLGGEPSYMALRPLLSCVPASITGSETLQLGEVWGIKLPDGSIGNGVNMFEFLSSCAADRGISAEAGTLKLATPAKELIQDPSTKEILGVVAAEGATGFRGEGGTKIYVKAKKGVILACGGFECDQDMIHQSVASHSHSLVVPTMGTPYNTGDGIWMAARVGAKLWHMNSAEVYHRCAKLASEEYGVGIPINDTADHIWVNRYGKRFMNERIYWVHTKETLPPFHFSHKKEYLDGVDFVDYPNVPWYMIFDETTRKKAALSTPGNYYYALVHKVYEWSDDNSAEIEKGWIIKGDTIEELGNNIVCKDFFGRVVGMDAAGLAEAVNKYNQYCAAGNDPDFGRPAAQLVPIETPPFYAMELCIGNINTNGGPVHNQHSQSLDVEGKPIPRLYSTGEFGSIYGYMYLGGGNFPEALFTGRIAGEHAAALQPWS